jgi:hypothetical protein
MKKESDRGCILVGLSEIDEVLGELLSIILSAGGSAKDAEWLLNPLAGDRPLANLAIRTRLARCLGLIDNETRMVTDALRSIRNKYAHATADFKLSANDVAPVVAAWKAGTRKFVGIIAAKYFQHDNVARIQLVGSVFAISSKLRNAVDALNDDGVTVNSFRIVQRQIRKQPAWRRLSNKAKRP